MKFLFNLQLFADPELNTTGSEFLKPEIKEFYNTALLENVRAELLYERFADPIPLPGGNGKTVELRRMQTLKKATKPLVEGVTPKGNKAKMVSIKAEVEQYGDYTIVTDRLKAEAVDPIVSMITVEHAAQAKTTLNTITRDIVGAGTSVMYANNKKARHLLTSEDLVTARIFSKAATLLKKTNTPKIKGYYVAMVNPSVSDDLRNDPAWVDAHKYSATEEIFDGSIGRMHGIVFFESTEEKVHHGADLCEESRELTIKTAVSASSEVTVNETLEADALVGRYVLIGDKKYVVTENTAAKLTLADYLDPDTPASVTAEANTTIYPGEGGAEGIATYDTLVFGQGAFGAVKPTKESMEMIVKGLGSGGTEDALNQRSSVGWKASHGAVIKYEERMVRIETASSYSEVDEEN